MTTSILAKVFAAATFTVAVLTGSLPAAAASKIQHVIVIIQENRSFDNLFAGFPGADTQAFGFTHTGKKILLYPRRLSAGIDACHAHTCWKTDFFGGGMNGFDLTAPNGQSSTFNYAYVPEADVDPYWQMAKHYTIADRMFQSNSGDSFPAHLYLIGGQSSIVAENPGQTVQDRWGCDSSPGANALLLGPDGSEIFGPFPCYTFPTLADRLDARGVTWRYYAPVVGASGGAWSAFDAIRQVRFGTDWTKDVITPETQILSDIAAGTLEQVTWVAPKFKNSDHAGPVGATGGPAWVSSIVNAVGASKFWSSTAIFVVWDDWGGWYDHVSPPQLDPMGLGFRVPLLAVSPYAKAGYVSHVQHEFGSIVHFIEVQFGLPSLNRTDLRADDLSDCFNFAQAPRPAAPIRFKGRAKDFIEEPPSPIPPDGD